MVINKDSKSYSEKPLHVCRNLLRRIWIKFQEQVDQEKQIVEQKAADFPLDHYLDFEKNKNKYKTILESERTEHDLGPQRFSRTEKLIKQINDLATEAEEKVKACIHSRAGGPSSVFSPVSLDESDSCYTEHLVEAKFNEVTFQKQKIAECKPQKEIKKDQPIQFRSPYISRSNNNPTRYGRETHRSTAETMSVSPMPHKQINRKKFNTKLDTTKHNPQYIPKSSRIINPDDSHFRHELAESLYPKTTCHYCSCTKEAGIGYYLKQHSKGAADKGQCQHKGNKLFIEANSEQINVAGKEKQYNDVSVNTDPLLVRPNTNLVNVVSLKEEESSKMNDYAKKLCQIQELPLVVIRPNFTKQIGPVIDIKMTTPLSPKKNVAVVECIHGGTSVGPKENTLINVSRESAIDSGSQTVSPPAVHFKNSRDLKLLKVSKDLLGKLNFKDGTNVERLKRSLTSLVSLLNQISPIHVANLRLSNLDAGSASESIDTFFSNIDLVTEIIENEIKKPTGRYCDYPECLIKAVDLLCGNIKSVFVIEDIRKRTSKPFVNNGPGEEKKKIKKSSVPRVRKQSNKATEISRRSSSANSLIGTHEKEGNMSENIKSDIPESLYIPYRLLIPGGKHKAMEEAKNSRDIELRFKRLEKVLEINENLKKTVPSKETSQTDHSVRSLGDEDKSTSNKDAHVLNETFIIKSASDDESEIVQEQSETKINKAEQDYEDDWEVDSSKSYDGSLAMTEINVVAQIHSSRGQSSLAHSSPKKIFPPKQCLQELSGSNKSSQTGNLDLRSDSSSRASQNPLNEKESKDMKRHPGKVLGKKKVYGGLKDVETQYYVSKRDIATMYCEEVSKSQKPKVEIIEPIATPPEAGSFTVLRMTNATTNSLLEVRFPEQTEKLQSSLTVQKTHNSEEVKLLYNLDKEEKMISWQGENEIKSIPPQKEAEKLESLQIDNPQNANKVTTKCEQSDDKSSQKKEELNDFQNITTNFIQFLENKVTEMVNKFKTSEVTCEKILDQKLMCRVENKAYPISANSLHISSSKTSLKNEVFYKSASSLISNQSNEDFGNWLSRRCTPENQEIIPFENLTSPSLGLQLKDCSTLRESSESQNMDPKPNLEKIEDSSNLFQMQHNEVEENQNSVNVLNKFNHDLISGKVTENMKLVLKEREMNKMPHFSGLQNRLLPLPGDVSYDKSSSSNKEKEKVSFRPVSQMNVVTEIHERTENCDQKNSTIQQAVQTSSLKSNGTAIVQEVGKSQKKSAAFEEAMLALERVEHIFDDTDDNEESTVIVAKTPPILSRSEDELDSQGTSVSHFANILSGSESGIAPKFPFQDKKLMPASKDPNSICPPESKIIHQEQKAVNSAEMVSMKKDFSRLLPIPEQIEKPQLDVKFSGIVSQAVSNASVHSLFVSGPSHVDLGLKSSDSIFRKTDHCSVLTLKNELLNSTSETQFIPSNGGSEENIKNLTADDLSHTSNITKSDTTINYISFKNISQLLPPPPSNNKTTEKKLFCCLSPTSQLQEDIIKTLPLSAEDVSEISDDCIKLNYFNPEEMSDGEIGFVYTSHSYSSGEIKPYNDQNEYDSLTEPPAFQAINQHFQLTAPDLVCGEPLIMNNTSENRAAEIINFTEDGTSDVGGMFKDIMDSVPTKNQKKQENISVDYLLNSSNDSTSTGELKNLFSSEEKIDEGKLIDIHAHCSTRFSSESSGCAESVVSRESREEDI